MSKFVFRLASLLRLREATRDERRGALAEAYRVADLLRERLDRVEHELGELRATCRRAAGPGPVDVDRLVETQRYELALKGQQTQIQRQCDTVAGEIERRRQALLEADREVRVLEKLREHRAEQHRKDEEYRDARRLDEVAQQRAVPEVA